MQRLLRLTSALLVFRLPPHDLGFFVHVLFVDKGDTHPTATGATVNGKALAISFDKNVKATQVPAANRFRYTRGDGTILHTPRSVSISGSTVSPTSDSPTSRGSRVA